MTLEVCSLVGRSVEELMEIFNRGFQEYVIPMHMNLEKIRGLLERENIDLSLSVEGVVDGQNVGFCWTGIRGEIAWCGGIGVAPEQRGKGYGRVLMTHCIELVLQHGMRKYTLECIKSNERALELYKSLGLKVTGDLLNFKHMQPEPLELSAGQDCIRMGTEIELCQFWDNLHRVPKSWQGDLPSLLYNTTDQYIRFLTDAEGHVNGCMVYVESPRAISVRDLATDTENPGQCLMLLAELHTKGKPVYVQFVPERSVLVQVLQDVGYERFTDQVQMELEL